MRRSILALLLLTAVPGQAAPQYTGRLENASAPEVLRRLEPFYGLPMTLAPVRGPVAWVEQRATLEWQKASLGKVIGDVERVFRLQAKRGADGALSFSPPDPSVSTLTVTTEPLTITLREICETVTHRKLIGAGTVDVERALRLTLGVQSRDGEPERVRALTELVVRDQRGVPLATLDARLRPRANPADSIGPDEVLFQVDLPASPARGASSIRLDGIIAVSRSARTYRTEFAGPGYQSLSDRSQPVQVKVLPAKEAPHRALTLKVSWPETWLVEPGAGSTAPAIHCFIRRSNGSVLTVGLSGILSQVDPGGSGAAELTLALPAELRGDETLVCDVTALEPHELPISFQFPRVPLPLAATPHPGPSPRK